jgi:hypothetical protein
MQVAAHAVGADHHDGAHRVARRLQHVGLDDGSVPVSTATALSLTFFSISFSTMPQLPSSAETSSPLACSGQLGLDHEAPLAFLRMSPASSFSAPKKSATPVDRFGVVEIGGVQLLDVVGVAAIEERGEGKLVVGLI